MRHLAAAIIFVAALAAAVVLLVTDHGDTKGAAALVGAGAFAAACVAEAK